MDARASGSELEVDESAFRISPTPRHPRHNPNPTTAIERPIERMPMSLHPVRNARLRQSPSSATAGEDGSGLNLLDAEVILRTGERSRAVNSSRRAPRLDRSRLCCSAAGINPRPLNVRAVTDLVVVVRAGSIPRPTSLEGLSVGWCLLVFGHGYAR